MGPPSYTALSVSTHHGRIHEASGFSRRVAPPNARRSEIHARGGANRHRDRIVCTLVPCSRDRQVGSDRSRAHTASTTPSPPAHGVCPAISTARPALSSGPLCAVARPRHHTTPTHRRPAASPQHGSHHAKPRISRHGVRRRGAAPLTVVEPKGVAAPLAPQPPASAHRLARGGPPGHVVELWHTT